MFFVSMTILFLLNCYLGGSNLVDLLSPLSIPIWIRGISFVGTIAGLVGAICALQAMAL